ncbi:MAG: PDGLE domain-containing protein [Actinobacteria bacterium]|nr:PDGLE domain-containing protein [Actinomycetota bacterium]MCL6088413.1 PDGLE domain-containing protein [Actinomycetota bacterium]
MKIKDRIFILLFAIAAVIVGLFLSPFASSYPDGLEKVAQNLGFADKASNFVNFKFIIPDYLFPGIKSTFWQTSLAGFFGILIIFAVFAIILGVLSIINKNKNSKDKLFRK